MATGLIEFTSSLIEAPQVLWRMVSQIARRVPSRHAGGDRGEDRRV